MPICGKKGIIGSFISQDHLLDGSTARTGATNIESDFVRWASAHLILYTLMSSSPVLSPNTLGFFHAGNWCGFREQGYEWTLLDMSLTLQYAQVTGTRKYMVTLVLQTIN